MDENQQEQNKFPSLLDRIRETVLKKSSKNSEEPSDTSDISDTSDMESQEIPVEPPLGRGVVNVAPDSLLFSLWSEWKEAANGSNADDSRDDDTAMEELYQLEPFDLVLEAAGTHEIPMSTPEIEAEKQRATIQLMIKAKKYKQLTLPNEEGVVPNLDAYMVVHVAKSRMAAWAFVFPPSGNGKLLHRSQIHMALHEYSVCAGIDQKAVEYLVEEQPYFKLVPIAYGTPMIPGEDGSVDEKFKRKVEKTFAMNERGDVDYRTQNYIQSIHTGDILCEAIPPTQGIDGFDVLGTPIPAKHGEPAKLLTGQNTKLSEDETQIIASMDGHLLYEGGKFHVKPLFYVTGDVDLKVGNIDFLGDVHITGDVRDDFMVHATGTITVDGLVEGAIIEAGKDVFIAKGILGDEKAVIKAGGNVQTEYIENCIVYAGDTVQASSIISSYIHCDNKISVLVGRGTIIGGKLVAANRIEAKVIGCRTERPTDLTVGELPYMQKEKEVLEEEIKKIGKEKAELARGVNSANYDTADPTKLQVAANPRLRASILAMQEAHLQKQLAELGEETVDPYTCRITADTIYPITKIHIQDIPVTITEKTMSCKIHLGEDSIELI